MANKLDDFLAKFIQPKTLRENLNYKLRHLFRNLLPNFDG